MSRPRFLYLPLSLLVVLLALGPDRTHAHAILTAPLARTGSNGNDNLGIKIPSPQDAQFFNTCGNAATQPGPASATLEQGRPFTVAWDITIDHVSDPGVSVAFRCGGGNGGFTNLARGVTAQDQEVQVTMPRAAAGACELQWIWTSLEDGGSYIACADIQVVAPGAAQDQATPAPPPPAANQGGNANAGGNGGNNQGNGGQSPPPGGVNDNASPAPGGGFLSGSFFSNINPLAPEPVVSSGDGEEEESVEDDQDVE